MSIGYAGKSVNYRTLSKMFGGICHNSLREVIKHFEDAGILKRVFYNFEMSGQQLINVMYIALNS